MQRRNTVMPTAHTNTGIRSGFMFRKFIVIVYVKLTTPSFHTDSKYWAIIYRERYFHTPVVVCNMDH